jgi:hypothetical protein
MQRPVGSFRLPLALCASLVLGWGSPARAQGVPSPANSTVPAMIALVGATNGVPADAKGAFEVTIRDLANNPVAGAPVIVDLSNLPELHLCADPLDPDAIVDCAMKRVTKHTDALGRVRFTLLGGSVSDPPVRSPHGSGRIHWGGVMLIGAPTVAAYDLDGANGVGVNDLSLWLEDFGTGLDIGRGDYDGSGHLGVNDLSLWLGVFGSNACLESCAAACP